MSAVAEIQPMFFDEDGGNDLDIQFDPRQFEAITPYSDDLNEEYQQAQDQLRQLRQREEQIRRQTEELEELTRQEEAFKTGRKRVTEELTRHLATLDRQANEARILAEERSSAHERLECHLSSISSLHPESWTRADRKGELTRAISYIEAAEEEIDSILPLVQDGCKKSWFKGGTPLSSQVPREFQGNFLYWLKSGLAFSIPLVGFALISFLIMLFF